MHRGGCAELFYTVWVGCLALGGQDYTVTGQDYHEGFYDGSHRVEILVQGSVFYYSPY